MMNLLFFLSIYGLVYGKTIKPSIVNNVIDCDEFGTATSKDKCKINCDSIKSGVTNVYCRSAGQCYIDCNAQNCLSAARIEAENAGYLEIKSVKEACTSWTTIFPPANNGDTMINIKPETAADDDIFWGSKIQTTWYETSNAGKITVNCIDENDITNEECNGIKILGKNANYIEFNLVNTDGNDAKVECPVNPNYPSQPSSCIINAADASTTANMQIYTEGKGTPSEDVIFIGGGNGDYSNAKLFCADGESVISTESNSFYGEGACWEAVDCTVLWVENEEDSTDSSSSSSDSGDVVATITPTIVDNVIDCNQYGTATVGDICEINCDAVKSGVTNVYCRNAGVCRIDCNAQNCLSGARIEAENAGYLEINSVKEACTSWTTVFPPANNGDTMINIKPETVADDDIFWGSKIQTTWYETSKAGKITVNCIDENDITNEECNGIKFLGKNANYIEFNLVNADGNDAKIECPVDPNYPSQPSSCIINAAEASTTANMQIYSDKGTPSTDLVFYGGGDGDYMNTKIFCTNGESVISTENNLFDEQGDCWEDDVNCSQLWRDRKQKKGKTKTSNYHQLITDNERIDENNMNSMSSIYSKKRTNIIIIVVIVTVISIILALIYIFCSFYRKNKILKNQIEEMEEMNEVTQNTESEDVESPELTSVTSM